MLIPAVIKWIKCLPTWCLLLHDKLTVTDVDLVGIPNHFIGVLVPDALRILHWKRSNIAVYGCFLLSDYFQNFDLFALFDPFQEKNLSMYMGIEPGIVPMICCLWSKNLAPIFISHSKFLLLLWNYLKILQQKPLQIDQLLRNWYLWLIQ